MKLFLTEDGNFVFKNRVVGCVFPHDGKVHANLHLPRRVLTVHAVDVAAMVAELANRGVQVDSDEI